MTKFRSFMTLTISDQDMRKMLTETICGSSFTPFEALFVSKFYQVEGAQFVVELAPKATTVTEVAAGAKAVGK